MSCHDGRGSQPARRRPLSPRPATRPRARRWSRSTILTRAAGRHRMRNSPSKRSTRPGADGPSKRAPRHLVANRRHSKPDGDCRPRASAPRPRRDPPRAGAVGTWWVCTRGQRAACVVMVSPVPPCAIAAARNDLSSARDRDSGHSPSRCGRRFFRREQANPPILSDQVDEHVLMHQCHPELRGVVRTGDRHDLGHVRDLPSMTSEPAGTELRA